MKRSSFIVYISYSSFNAALQLIYVLMCSRELYLYVL